MKVAAIVPAYNEEATIGNVLKTLLSSGKFDEVIAVVDQRTTDQTAKISKNLGAKVKKVPHRGGKGKAMQEGLKMTQAEIIAFFDADLVGLSQEHITTLLQPVLKKTAVMSVGLRDRWGGLPEIMVKITPLFAIGGERAMKRFVFENLPLKFIKGFAVETALNYYCKINKLPVRYVKLKGLDIIVKEKKWGIIRGFLSRLKLSWHLLKIRILILIWRKEFKR